MKKIAPVAIAGVLLLAGAGCGNAKVAVKTTPAAPAAEQKKQEPEQPKADGFVSAMRAKLAIAKVSYTDKSEMGDVAKMQNKDAVSDAIKFKVTGGSGSVRVLMISVKDASKRDAVTTELKAQYDQLLALSASTRITWLEGDATHIVLVYYSVGDEETANTVITALGGQAAAPQAADLKEVKAEVELPGANAKADAKAEVSAGLKAGDKVLANWKGGSKWWEAVVTKVDASGVSVTYDSDKTTDTLALAAVVLRPSKAATVKIGDKVVAKWNGGAFYGGTISAVANGKATVKWGDGDTPTEVSLADIVVLK